MIHTRTEASSLTGLFVRALPILIPAVTFLFFLPALSNGFVNWDDDSLFLNNPHYRGLGWRNLRWMFTTTYMANYQPLTWLTLAVDHRLWGMAPVGYHLTSLLLHSLNAALLYFIARRLILRALDMPRTEAGEINLCAAASFAALAFSLHPLRVESVVWISERRDVLSGFFFLSAMLCYLNASDTPPPPNTSGRRYWLVGTLLIYILSLLSKGIGMTLPAVFLILDIYPLRRLEADPRRWLSGASRSVLVEKIPLIIPAIFFALLTLYAQTSGGQFSAMEEYGLAQRIAQAFYGVWFYLGKTFFPIDLAPVYMRPLHLNPLAGPFLISSLGFLIFSACLWAFRRRWPAGLAAWACYLVTLFPVLGLVQFSEQLVADRYSYLPCISWAILAAGAALAIRNDERLPMRRLSLPLPVVGLALVVMFGLLTWRQSCVWRDSSSLWSHTLAIEPDNPIAHHNLAQAFADQGKFPEAEKHYREALRIKPDYIQAHNNLGTLLLKKGNWDDAIAHIKEAVKINPRRGEPYNNLGISYAGMGNLKEAVKNLRLATQVQPDYAEAYSNLCSVIARQGALEEAAEYCSRALRMNPKLTSAHDNLGLIRAAQGRWDDAVALYREALRINPDYLNAHNNLALALAEQGKMEEAIEHYRNCLRLNPNLEVVHNNLGLAFIKQGKPTEAAAAFGEAVRINPKYAVARNNLGAIFLQQGRLEQAAAEFRAALESDPAYLPARKNWAYLGSLRPNSQIKQRADSVEQPGRSR